MRSGVRLASVEHDPDDATLVAQALEGDKEAFGALAERYYRMISVLAYQKTGQRADAEDIVQEALVRAFKALPNLRDPRKFAAWIYNITLKLCIDWARRRQRRDSAVPLNEATLAPAESGRFARARPQVGQELEAREEHDKILAAVGQLPDRYRLVMTLRYVKKLSYRDIAEHLGEPPGTIANRLHRAMRMVQGKLGVKREGSK